jgi:B9 domain-containing protein 2
MAELHIIGEICGGRGMGGGSMFCVFEVVTGVQWAHIEGHDAGSTHVSYWNPHPVWAHPIDLHYTMQSVQGWPKVSLQVWSVDEYGRKDLMGYGTCHVPLPSKDTHTIEVAMWKPTYWHPSGWVRMWRQFRQGLLGGNPILRDDSLVHGSDSRFKLHSVNAGTVVVRLTVLTKNGAAVGLHTGGHS